VLLLSHAFMIALEDVRLCLMQSPACSGYTAEIFSEDFVSEDVFVNDKITELAGFASAKPPKNVNFLNGQNN